MGRFPLEEHQLDYDWRFTEETAKRLAEIASSASNILLLGCPSLAVMLAKNGPCGELIERNPNYVGNEGSFDVVHADIRFQIPTLEGARHFSHAFVDPPWYPQELLHWTNFALARVEDGGRVFFTLWPESVRPTARDEHHRVLGAISEVGQLEQLGLVTYQLPLFERKAFQAAGRAASNRDGLLFQLTKSGHHLLEIPPFQRTGSEWHRFTLSGEQLAILVDPAHDEETHNKLFEVEPFTLTDTSRRNVNLQQINIWTSKNRVGRLFKPSKLARQISAQEQASLVLLAETMNMEFDPFDIEWGKSWRHPA